MQVGAKKSYCCGYIMFVIIGIHLICKIELFEVVGAICASCRFACRTDCGKQQGGQDSDNCNHNKEFYQRESMEREGIVRMILDRMIRVEDPPVAERGQSEIRKQTKV